MRLSRSRTPSWVPVIPAALLALAVSGCTTSTFTEGEVKKVCGQVINSAAGDLQITWYHDLTEATHPDAIDLPATPKADYGAAPWLLVSPDCAHGASVTVTPSGKTQFLSSVRTADGNYAAIQLDAHLAGTVTLVVHHGTTLVSSTTVRTTGRRQPTCPSITSLSPGPSCP
jgi:hypothetical protein